MAELDSRHFRVHAVGELLFAFVGGCAGSYVALCYFLDEPTRFDDLHEAVAICCALYGAVAPILLVLAGASFARAARLGAIERAGLDAWAVITGLNSTLSAVGRTSAARRVYRIALHVHGPNGTFTSFAYDPLPRGMSKGAVKSMWWRVRIHPEDPQHSMVDWSHSAPCR